MRGYKTSIMLWLLLLTVLVAAWYQSFSQIGLLAWSRTQVWLTRGQIVWATPAVPEGQERPLNVSWVADSEPRSRVTPIWPPVSSSRMALTYSPIPGMQGQIQRQGAVQLWFPMLGVSLVPLAWYLGRKRQPQDDLLGDTPGETRPYF